MVKRLFILVLAVTVAVSTAAAAAASDGTVDVPVVMYHHISENVSSLGEYVISPGEFESDLMYLRDNGYNSITVSELISWTEGSFDLPDKPVMITFDDGYESTYVYALPLLRKYGMTATVAVIGRVSQEYTDTPDHNLAYSHMTWDMVADSYRSGVFDIQCHTWDMHHLSPRKGCGRMNGESDEAYFAALSADIGTFQERCIEYTGRSANTLVLPFGFYNDDTIEAAKMLGFTAVFTCTERVNRFSGDKNELYNICRYNRPHGKNSEEFFEKWR